MKKQFFYSMLAAAMLVSCSSEKVTENSGEFFDNGEGYVSLAINLPTRAATSRANDDFDDGLNTEYLVNNATLIIFAGSDEASATCSSAYTLKSGAWNNNGDSPNQITVTRQITQKIKSASGNLYAFVVLNHNGIFAVQADNSLQVGGAAFTGTISDLQSKISTVDFTTNGILMMNAPLSKFQGNTTSNDPGATGFGITTLAPIAAEKIKATAAEAEASPAANVYVERAVAKTTVNTSSSITTSFNGSDGNAIAYTVNGWKLDNTTKQSYIAHKVDATAASLSLKSTKSGALYRMAGNNVVEAGAGYRYYWAIDPDYDADVTATNFNRLAGTTPSWNTPSATVPEYCKENTFDVAHMTYQNTTSVLVKATLNSGTTFYTVNGENKLYTETGYKTAFFAAYLSSANFINWFNTNCTDASYSPVEADFTFTYNTESATGLITVTAVEVKTGSTLATSKLKTGYAAAPTDASTLGLINETKVLQYTNGASYYHVRIKHFGDDLTPWNNGEGTTNMPTAAKAYNGANDAEINNRYLGRYGMVRNNWYDVTISGIKQIGSPVIPSLAGDATTDDNLESYISVKINVLSWAKRTQSVTL